MKFVFGEQGILTCVLCCLFDGFLSSNQRLWFSDIKALNREFLKKDCCLILDIIEVVVGFEESPDFIL